MKLRIKKVILITALVVPTLQINQLVAKSCSTTCSTTCGCTCVSQPCTDIPCNQDLIFGKTFYAARSQGDNSARKMMGVENKIHINRDNCYYNVSSITLEYQSGFKDRGDIGKWFSVNGNSFMTYGMIESSADNNLFNINALQFGVTGSGTITFCPKFSDVILDTNIYLGLDSIFCGLWARFDIPLVHNSRFLHVVEDVTGVSSETYPINLYGSGAVDAEFANDSQPMMQALKGDMVFGTGIGEVPELHYAKICGKRVDTNLAGLRIDLGYDWFIKEHSHLATSLDIVAPAGSTTSATYLFDAMVSDSKRTQIGATVNARYDLYCNCDCQNLFSFYLDATVTSLLKKRLQRTIGLNITDVAAQNTWSQYLILKTFNNANQLTGLERAANILSPDLKIGAGVIADLAFMFEWDYKDYFSAGLGYEFWIRTTEKISESCLNINGLYAMKGVQSAVNSASTLIDNNATINSVSASGTVFAADLALPENAASEIYDYSRALHPKAYSNKIFGFLEYNWCSCNFKPFALLGGEIEFGKSNRALTTWGVLGKCGVSF